MHREILIWRAVEEDVWFGEGGRGVHGKEAEGTKIRLLGNSTALIVQAGLKKRPSAARNRTTA